MKTRAIIFACVVLSLLLLAGCGGKRGDRDIRLGDELDKVEETPDEELPEEDAEMDEGLEKVAKDVEVDYGGLDLTFEESQDEEQLEEGPEME